MTRIIHPIPPVFDERSRVLVLGSMPSPASRALGFNYGHPQNRFWRVMAHLAGEPMPATNERKRDFCLRHHIALWDVIAECEIDGASDASIRNARPNDLASIVHAAPIEAVYCTGVKAFELYRKLGCEEACGLSAMKLPSTSPANAAYSLGALTEAYAQVFEHTHEFGPPVLSVAQVIELEQAVSAHGTSLAELMDRAGAAVAHRVQEVLEKGTPAGTRAKAAPGNAAPAGAAGAGTATAAGREPLVAILCGNGNNGGDGWVAAELLVQAGIPVCLVSARAPEDITAQPAHDAAMRAFTQLNVLIDPPFEELGHLLGRAAVVVDAMFGCGLHGGISREPFITWVELANRTREGRTTIAVDIPSGVSADLGAAAPQTATGAPQTAPRIVASETVTMMVPKPGLSAPECGAIHVAPLAYIEPLLSQAPSSSQVDTL